MIEKIGNIDRGLWYKLRVEMNKLDPNILWRLRQEIGNDEKLEDGKQEELIEILDWELEKTLDQLFESNYRRIELHFEMDRVNPLED